MSEIKLKSLLLKEFIEVSDMQNLEKASKAFALTLLKNKVLTSRHKDLTASDLDVNQYVEDIAEVVRNEVLKWMDTANRRGGR
jgi:hypothetical protein